MQRWIEHPSEPNELLLAWQAPVSVEDRTRWAVGRLTKFGHDAVFRYLNDKEISEFNGGRSRSELNSYGYIGYPAFEIKKQPVEGFTQGVLEAFARRMPPMSRPDIGMYLQHFRYQSDTPLSVMAMLALTEARLPSDGFSLIDPLDPDADLLEVVFEIAGHRHNSDTHKLLYVGQELKLVLDPKNAYDSNAVRIEANGNLIGFVNRLQAPSIGSWLKRRSVSAWIVRLNGTETSPRAFAYVQVRKREDLVAA